MCFRLGYLVLLAGLLATLPGAPALGQNSEDANPNDDEAQLALLEKHVAAIESAMQRVAKLKLSKRTDAAAFQQAATEKDNAVDELEEILQEYFIKERIKPPAMGKAEGDEAYLKQVMIADIMHIYVAKLRTTDDERFCVRVRSLIDKLRAALAAGDPSANQRAEVDLESKASEVNLDEMELHLLKTVNAYRKKQGLPPLSHDGKLSAAAKDHSGDMQRLNFFSHNSPVAGKTKFRDRAKKFDTTASAENIAQDCKDAEMAIKLWINSQHHRDNILGPYERIGIGRQEGYYTQKFGK